MKISRTLLEPILVVALVLLISLLFLSASNLSFSYKEALLILGEERTLLAYFTRFWVDLFGTNSIIVRLPFIFFLCTKCSLVISSYRKLLY